MRGLWRHKVGHLPIFSSLNDFLISATIESWITIADSFKIIGHNKSNVHTGIYRFNKWMFQWSGLLIEPNRIYFDLLQRKNRKAWTFGHCLSTKRHTEVVLFQGWMRLNCFCPWALSLDSEGKCFVQIGILFNQITWGQSVKCSTLESCCKK